MAVAYLLQEAVVLRQKKKKADRRHQRGGKSTSELEQISLESF